MLDFEVRDSSFTFGSSPPNRPFVAEGSDLFKAVMEDIRQDCSSRLCNAVVDVMTKKSSGKDNTTDDSNITRKHLCKRCMCDRTMCRCGQDSSRSALHKVQWIDELYDKPLAVEQTISDQPPEGRVSPLNISRDQVKPILKHKANCIIIVSE